MNFKSYFIVWSAIIGISASTLWSAPTASLTVKDLQQQLPGEILSVDGRKIGKTEFMKFFLNQLPGRKIPRQLKKKHLPALFRIYAEAFVDDFLVELLLKQHQVKGTPEEVQKFYFQRYKSMRPDEKVLLERRLKSRKLSVKRWIEQQSRNFEVQQEIARFYFMQKHFAPKREIQESEIQQYYKSNSQRFKLPEQREFSHIRCRYNYRHKTSKIAAQKKLEAVLKELKKHPQDFATIARRNSDCPSAANGGKLGALSPDMLNIELNKAAWKLRPGEISGIVDNGRTSLHIFRCDKIIPARSLTFEEVKGEIKALLQHQQMQKNLDEWLQKQYQLHRVIILLKPMPYQEPKLELNCK